MLLKKIVFCSLLIPTALWAAEPKNNDLHWSINKGWKLAVQPKAIVQSLDNKKVFILGEDSQIHIFSAEGNVLGTLPVNEGVVDIDIAPRGEAIYLVNSKDNSYTAIDLSFTQDIDISQAPILGNPDAPVTLVEFSDFECPFCSKVKPILHELIEKNPEKLKIAFKHLPLRMHAHAQQAALAAIAAQNQGKFWEMHDALFDIAKLSPEAIDATAKKIGLDMDQYKKDMAAEETMQRLGQDIRDAQQADVTGTPALYVNGVQVKQRSVEAIQVMIDEALGQE
ncbi:thioredoxin domain-containing protein [Desulfogranum japonicum]|uniref:thioredoxin domain-containing protein n=1 Tax=Desulfogranum japonicum TaxID=231447 RepID=UPI000405C306|nr:thioredoxin domain-containing protein [Desulfogranum japonicum]